MSRISVKDAVKRYGNNTVIPDLNLEIGDGELFTLLGPSGCGKTTLLRMIAGFNSIEGGDIFFNEKRINDMDPSKRNIGMVFQNYAIFPNLSVRDNVAFGLKNRKVDKAEIKKRTDEFLNLMQIMQYADRMPNQLSGGQQQRIALARALVISPDVLLMDIRMSPMSGLEASEEILKEKPEAKILLLTTFSDDEYIVKALKCGVKGYLLKQDYASILPAIRAVCTGQTVFGTQIISRLPELLERKSAFDYETYEITEKERDVMKLVADGKSNKEIAGEMFLSEGTIRNYISGILDKLNLRDRTQLAVFYLRNCT